MRLYRQTKKQGFNLVFKYQKTDTKSGRLPTFALRLSSALVGLTSVFGMGTGVPPLQEPPR